MKANPFLCFLSLGIAVACTTAKAQTKQPQKGTSSSDGQYRQSSSANGTAVNNSNSTNYNSNNATNAPTGVGSNPSVATDPTTLSGGSSSNTSAGSSNSAGASSSATNGSAKTGTSAAVTGARTSPTPAVVAGSTTRNSSIHDYIASSPNYITLQNALQSTQLHNLLDEGGAYTLFAPSNSAFKKLPAAMQAGLLEGRNQDKLKQLLSYHLIKGQLDKKELTSQINASSGKAQLQTLAGESLLAQINAQGQITLTDGSGKTVIVDSANQVQQSNGMVYGIDAVLLPKNGANAIR